MKNKIITSVAQYLSWVKTIHNIETNPQDICFKVDTLFFRGHASNAWDLRPNLLRDDDTHYDEYQLFHQTELKLWDELQKYNTLLEKLIFLQHYGLYTRLLDVTFNPLVALYFACCEREKCRNGRFRPGVVRYGYVRSDDDYTTLAEHSLRFVLKTNTSCFVEDIKKYAEENKFKMDSFTFPLFIYPPINNTRIEHQSGAFIMASLLKKDKNMDYSENRDGNNVASLFESNKCIIFDKDKSSILKELSELNIDRGTIMKDVPSVLKSIMEKAKNDIPKVIIQEKVWP